jgi:hypothetical protein
MKEYEVEFVAHHIINVEAETPEEAEVKAGELFNGFDKWEINVEEVEK